MASKVQLDLDHSKMKQGHHNGLLMPECYESLADHLPKLKAMEIREDDVLLCSFPKSGTHWMYRVIDMLQRGQVIYDKRTPDCTFLDIQRIERLVELDSPRLLVSHVPFDLLPQEAKDKRTKIVHVYRNPRAVLVSLCFQMAALEPDDEKWSIDKVADLMFAGKMPYSGWFNYMDKLHAYEKENPAQPILHVSYEEMTQNPLDTVKKLAEFLEKPGTPEMYAAIVEACSFKKQKESEESADPNQARLKFYRKGDMNDWKNYVTVAVNEKFEEVLKGRAGSCPFSAKY
ncbi:sulfotransferase 1A1-like [Babylonia areolata]|uniref:sulfotransferase 1A1-like n=1 Tax=Babylonia areolata TaxID=304850 RepID=UPI003FD2001D